MWDSNLKRKIRDNLVCENSIGKINNIVKCLSVDVDTVCEIVYDYLEGAISEVFRYRKKSQ